MIWPGIEFQSPEPVADILAIMPMSRYLGIFYNSGDLEFCNILIRAILQRVYHGTKRFTQ